MNFRYETKKIKSGFKYVIGCDEVGRGCLAGPVVAAAVALPQVESSKVHKVIKSAGIKDSKLLAPAKREELSALIKKYFLWSIAEVSSEVIDEINIHNASLLAMRKAVEQLLCHCERVHPSEAILSNGKDCRVGHPPKADWPPRNDSSLLAVDGKFRVTGLSIPQESIISGDNKVLSIAAASIIAKVYRDNLMQKLHQRYPAYNLKQHKGYATVYHRKIIIERGLSPLHRVSFCGKLKAGSLLPILA